jgi:hypothetical protein
MLAKCMNPSCSVSFRYLNEGRLFRLEQSDPAKSANLRATEYFWLCNRCSTSMTLRLAEGGGVMTVGLGAALQDVPQVASAPLNRRSALLTTVSFLRANVSTGSGGNTGENRHVPSRGLPSGRP